jgi:putative transposase
MFNIDFLLFYVYIRSMTNQYTPKDQISPEFLPPLELWEAAEKLLPPWLPSRKGGAPRKPDQQIFYAIFYILRSGIQWKALPRCLGAPSTVHDRFQEWRSPEIDLFKKLWIAGLIEYDERIGIDWKWQSIDSATTKAPLGQENTGPNPTDRGKIGTKRHLLTEGKGMPLSLIITGANPHDKTQVEAVLENIVIERPTPTEKDPQNLCGDKAYDAADVRECVVIKYGYTPHIKSRGEEIEAKKKIPGYRARRWVNERTHSWMNRYRRILIRWEKKTANYEAFLHLACACITFRAAGVFG